MDVGEVFLLCSLLSSIAASFIFLRCVEEDRWKPARIALLSSLTFLTAALLTLLYYFFARDFSVQYVFEYSDIHLSTLYTISALWAGREGSLLLWAWYLVIFNTVLLFSQKNHKDRVVALALAISTLVVIFFNVLLLTSSNPFVRLDFRPPNGIGLNPLLRTPEMAFHPPTIFLGYAGMTIPFALAIAATFFRENWIKLSRKYLIVSWAFLSIGILLGAWWAYKTLGWGGFWGWDPVENASLLPWLTASALLHGMIVEERKRGLKLLNYALAIITFDLVILATFVTRSGIISSVHAFGQNPEAHAYLALIALATAVGITVWALRRDFFSGSLEGVREKLILGNMVILLLSMATVLLGTLAPLFIPNASVDRHYYDRLEIPLGTALVVLLGICAAIDWRADREKFIRYSKYSAVVGLIAGVAVYLSFKATIAAIGIAIFFFSLLNHVQDLRIVDIANRRKIGGYVAHIGLIFLFIGVMGAWLYEESYKPVTIEYGKSAQVGSFELRLVGFDVKEDEEKFCIISKVEIYENGELQGVTYPKLIFYKLMRQDRVVSSVEIISQPFRDLYIAMGGVSKDGSRAYFEFYVVPLVSFVWLGSMLIIAGGIVALMPSRRAMKRAE
ncbi:heme lyase CcmF/NrfE family subunit [Archaeoglobus veneficus]|uniref:Cytochrome c assembly protein n=1 Tax=Archaeoglobus veneficus (strain DSM 11195 / SNP6) TaxID=693661 RepID=F2KS43_ARCVS|nr:cytochrome c biogenesis protein CcsA [Archaeoglobus veneficus]AEA47982.1 cytochrome c assembly protein [Archaeoglobus veneficus SNP6]